MLSPLALWQQLPIWLRSGGALMGVVDGASPATPAADQAAGSRQLLVQWQPNSSARERSRALAALGGQLIDTIHSPVMRQAGQGVLEVIQLPAGLSLEQGMALYARRPGVKLVEPNAVVGVQATPSYSSNDSAYTSGSLWGMYGDNTSPANSNGSQAGEAWAAGAVGSNTVVVGVIDSGIDYTHPDLYLNIWLNQGEIRSTVRDGLSSYQTSLGYEDGDGLITFRDLNRLWNDLRATSPAAALPSWLRDWNNNGRIDGGDLLNNNSGWEDGDDNDGSGRIDDLIGWDFANNDNDPFDDNNHGTHCAGTIAGLGGNSIGVAGVTWDTTLLPLKFLGRSGSGSLSAAIAAVDYYSRLTLNDATANSATAYDYLGTSNSWGGGGYTASLEQAIRNGAGRGNLFIAAAGNSSANNDSTASYPSNYTAPLTGGGDGVVAVASTTKTGAISSFSSFGKTTVDIAAPGSEITSTVPGGYASYNGTSMATPHVSGSLALLAAAWPGATRTELLNLLYGGVATTNGTVNYKDYVKYGRLDIFQSFQGVNAPMLPERLDPALALWGTTASDTLSGGANNDRITGVAASGSQGAALGRGQIDKLTGKAGADVFLLADGRGSFYNDGSSTNQGATDYAWIQDFGAGDKLQLRSGVQYLYVNTDNSTAIYLSSGDQAFSVADEWIARVDWAAEVTTSPFAGSPLAGTAASILSPNQGSLVLV
ncbi:MAG: S8 family serine peptidase [Synechococcaceae cyanobacterium]|nr:S8 family serine peptidase [Synechococcaceae cyanobacterium]